MTDYIKQDRADGSRGWTKQQHRTCFTVYGKVRGQSRPRFTTRGKFTRAYKDKRDIAYEQEIVKAYREAGGTLHTGAVEVHITAYRALPQSRPLKVTHEPDTFKPDVDNICKIFLDALNGVAYKDDAQVVYITAKKQDRKRRPEEFVTVLVEDVKEQQQ